MLLADKTREDPMVQSRDVRLYGISLALIKQLQGAFGDGLRDSLSAGLDELDRGVTEERLGE